MTPQEEQEFKKLVTEAIREDRPGWIAVLEKIIIPIILGLSTVVLGIVGWKSNETGLKLTAGKQRLDSINAVKVQKQDSLVSDRNFQLDLMKRYSEDISSGDENRRINANFLIRLMDSAFAKKVLSFPWGSSYTKKDGVIYSKQGSDIVKSQSDILLAFSNIKVYYSDMSKQSMAQKIDTLLRSHGAQSSTSVPKFRLTKNQIVYYNISQLNYCKAVQDLLQKNNYGNFEIRESSGASPNIDHFKIYVAQ